MKRTNSSIIDLLIPPVAAESCSSYILRAFVFSVHAMMLKNALDCRLQDFLEDRRGFERYCGRIAGGKDKATALCVASFMSNWDDTEKFIRSWRQRKGGGCPVVLFGPCAAYFHEQLLKERLADVVVRADAEFTVPSVFLVGAASGRLAGVANIAFSSGSQMRRTPIVWNDHLDEIPFVSPYFVKRKVFPVTVLTTRGCPFPCTFCDRGYLWGKRVRRRSPDNVVAELEMLDRVFRVREIFFGDDNFLIDPRRAMALCREILRRKLRLRWDCNSRIDAVAPTLLKLMKLAGCRRIYFGLESGAPRVRRALGKNYSNETALRAIRRTRQAGIRVGLYVILAGPQEDRKSLDETKSLLKKLAPFDSLDINPLTLLPGTRLYEQYRVAQDKGKTDFLRRGWPIFCRPDWRTICEEAGGLQRFLRISKNCPGCQNENDIYVAEER